jgi:hypothetical protein
MANQRNSDDLLNDTAHDREALSRAEFQEFRQIQQTMQGKVSLSSTQKDKFGILCRIPAKVSKFRNLASCSNMLPM